MCRFVFVVFFFFQAEDGIRDLVRSRGLGDVYKRQVLQTLLKEAADILQQVPRDVKFYRVLYHTCLHPAPTQEQAAELLDLPFSTYRRHLKTAIERVNDCLLYTSDAADERYSVDLGGRR